MASGERTSSLDELGQTVIAECKCPSCENFFDEPKCLPCAHSVCQKCLTDLVRHGSRRIECPVDGKRFRIPQDGIDSFPSNTLLVRLMKSLSKKARADIKRELKGLRGSIERTTNGCQEIASDLDASSAKLKIKETADQLRVIIEAKESQLCRSVETMAARREDTLRLVGHSLRKAEKVANKMEYILQMENDPGRILRKKDELISAARVASGDCTAAIPSNKEECFLDFTPNIQLQQHFNLNDLGSIFLTAAKTATPHQNPFAIPNHLMSKFRPQAIAANETGHIAVVDEGNDCILLFSEAGQFLRQIGGKESEHELYLPHSVTFRDNKELIIADGQGSTSHRLLVYDISGTFVKTLTKVNGTNVRLVSVFAEPGGRIFVACKQQKKQHRYCIRVCYRNCKDIQYVATEALICPSKVIWLSGNIYVLDHGRDSSVIRVYNKYGEYMQDLTESDTKPSHSATSGSMKVAGDPAKGQILVWRKSTKKVEVLKPDGALVRDLEAVVDGIKDMTVTSSGHLAVIKTNTTSSIQMLSYRGGHSNSD